MYQSKRARSSNFRTSRRTQPLGKSHILRPKLILIIRLLCYGRRDAKLPPAETCRISDFMAHNLLPPKTKAENRAIRLNVWRGIYRMLKPSGHKFVPVRRDVCMLGKLTMPIPITAIHKNALNVRNAPAKLGSLFDERVLCVLS